MGAGGGTTVAIVFAFGVVAVWTGIYFVHKWTGRRGRQVGKTRRNYGRGAGAWLYRADCSHPPHQSQPFYPERLLFIHEAGLPLDNLLQHAGGGMPRQPNRTPEHVHTNYIKEVAELLQEIFGQRVVEQDHPDDQSDSPGSSLNENRGHNLQGNEQVRQNKILRRY